MTNKEKEFDFFAIDFADWISANGFQEYSNGWAKLCDRGVYTTQELLELYKKARKL